MVSIRTRSLVASTVSIVTRTHSTLSDSSSGSEPASCGILAPPFVVSTSYGQDESSVTAAYAQRQCTEYAKLGMLGSTVLYSSGDNGVAGNGGICLDGNGPSASLFLVSRRSYISPSLPAGFIFIHR